MAHEIRLRFSSLVEKLGVDLGIDKYSVAYFVRRTIHEGVTFLTKTLPLLSKAVLTGLETGFLKAPTNFAWKGRSPRVMRSLLIQIFDPSTGLLLQDANPEAVGVVRQFCDYFYKLALDFMQVELQNAEAKYEELENELSRLHYDHDWLESLRKVAETIYPRIRDASMDRILSYKGPRDGPGSFYRSQFVPVDWWAYKRLPSRITGSCPEEFASQVGLFKSYPASREALRPRQSKKTVEVLFVPKDSRGPRVISREPLLLLRVQMAVFDWLSDMLERETYGAVQFADQLSNRQLAEEGSIRRNWTTGDLKDASDRVTFRLVRAVCRNFKGLRHFIRSARSTHATLPVSGRTIPIEKLGGMGSGLTFGILAMIVHCSAVTAVHEMTGAPLGVIARKIHVYGDDIICPTPWWGYVQLGLERSGLIVNETKSFTQGFFRESCGGDYYRGVDVTPLRLRLTNAQLGPASSNWYTITVDSDNGILQLERHCRELVKRGLIVLAEELYQSLEKAGIPLPEVSGESSVLGRYTLNYTNQGTVRGIAPVPVVRHYEGVCAYKHLGEFFQSRPRFCATSFGDVAVPRKIKLRRRLVADHHLAGLPSWDIEEALAPVPIVQLQRFGSPNKGYQWLTGEPRPHFKRLIHAYGNTAETSHKTNRCESGRDLMRTSAWDAVLNSSPTLLPRPVWPSKPFRE